MRKSAKEVIEPTEKQSASRTKALNPESASHLSLTAAIEVRSPIRRDSLRVRG
ncbi:hypothetical protein CKA32_006463 [Geitlerinema sp. FC II]|nr:hypothetical protein [Geitlerinema sp. CS-897]PPT10845.1 hypothetical protein CKA32_006463 [Geitlerinema sp. FC II]